MRLSELNTGEKGVVVRVKGHGGFRKRIVEMGFIKGKEVEVLLNAPLKDPVKYRIMGYEISLRRSEADLIEVLTQKEARREPGQVALSSLGTIEEDQPISGPELRKMALEQRRTIRVALVGNPNCGKTSLFNYICGTHEHTGNYSGVTVDVREGHFDFQGYKFILADLPGTYSLSAYSPEELYVRRYLIEETPDIIINVLDSSNLERNLYLTTQLIDMNVRFVCALNLYDELQASGNRLDYLQLSKLFAVPMVPTISRNGEGIETLFHIIINLYEGADFIGENGELNPEVRAELEDWHRTVVADSPAAGEGHMEDFTSAERPLNNVLRHIHINYGPELEQAIGAVRGKLAADESLRARYSLRYLSIKLLEGDREFQKLVGALPGGEAILETARRKGEEAGSVLNEDCETAITNAKYGFIDGALKEAYEDRHEDKRQLTKVLDSVVTHRIWGYPIFFLFLWVMFQATFVIGQYPMDWIEAGVGALTDWVRGTLPEGPLRAMLADGILGGVGGVIVFLPNILILYLFISLMEDSGYMARAAFIMDKIMHKMGLHGKSFIPLIMGFGCNVPAIMATRTIESRSNRLITMLAVPFMSCSARLPIYLLLTGLFFPRHGGLVMLLLYTAGILLAIGFCRIMSLYVVPKDEVPFVMELPPYRLPTWRSVAIHTWEKGKQYLRKMGGIILFASVLVWFLSYYPDHDRWSTAQEQQENSYIGHIGKFIEPALEPLGMNWKLGISLVSGAGAKEIVASTLCVLYPDEAQPETAVSAGAEEEGSISLAALERDGVTPLVAFCFMLFVVIYFPCVATIAAIRGESGSWKWALFAAVHSTALAWVVTFIVYQVGRNFF